jgi:hypothetical protein
MFWVSYLSWYFPYKLSPYHVTQVGLVNNSNQVWKEGYSIPNIPPFFLLISPQFYFYWEKIFPYLTIRKRSKGKEGKFMSNSITISQLSISLLVFYDPFNHILDFTLDFSSWSDIMGMSPCCSEIFHVPCLVVEDSSGRITNFLCSPSPYLVTPQLDIRLQDEGSVTLCVFRREWITEKFLVLKPQIWESNIHAVKAVIFFTRPAHQQVSLCKSSLKIAILKSRRKWKVMTL